ncbi:MAG TPA: hypothetical protein VN328_00235 [Thermodesulfovibrionales bacterium]|nr:hypothetical protein [Thermodesulfovibrionales bacterium]
MNNKTKIWTITACFLIVIICNVVPASAAQWGTLVIVNKTGATLTIEAWQHMPKEWHVKSSKSIPPGQTVSLFNFLKLGRIFVEISAPNAGGVNPIVKEVFVSGTGVYNIEISPGDFGKSTMSDVRSSTWKSPMVGVWEWSANGDVTFSNDGTFKQGSIGGKWIYYNNQVDMRWDNGLYDILRLSSNKRELDGYGYRLSDPGKKWTVWGRKR